MANILLVESQPYMGEFISEGLSQQGHRITRVTDPDSLVFRLEESAPDLLILDLNGLDGWDLLDEIKRFESRIPVLVVTAFDSLTEDANAGEAECCVIKDAAMNTLNQRIVEILQTNSRTGRTPSVAQNIG